MKNILLLLFVLGCSILNANSADNTMVISDLVDSIQQTDSVKFEKFFANENVENITPDLARTLLTIANNQLQNIREDASYYREARKESLRFFLVSLIAIVIAQSYTQQQNAVDAQLHPFIIGATCGAAVAFIDMLYYGIKYINTQWTNDKARKIVHELEHLTVQAYQQK